MAKDRRLLRAAIIVAIAGIVVFALSRRPSGGPPPPPDARGPNGTTSPQQPPVVQAPPPAPVQQDNPPQPPDLESLRGKCLSLANEGRFADAVPCFEQVVKLDPSAGAHSNLAGAFAALGRIDAAIDQLNQAIRIDPKNVESQYNLATMLMQTGKATEAIPHLEVAAKLKPDDPEIRDQLQRARLIAATKSVKTP